MLVLTMLCCALGYLVWFLVYDLREVEEDSLKAKTAVYTYRARLSAAQRQIWALDADVRRRDDVIRAKDLSLNDYHNLVSGMLAKNGENLDVQA